MDIRAIERYAKLLNEKADLEAQLIAVKAKMDPLTDGVLNYFQEHGIDKVSAHGRTLYLRRELWVGFKEEADRDACIARMQEMGLGEFVPRKLNTQSVSAWAREREREGEAAIPEQLAEFLVGNEVFKIGSRAK